MDSAFFRKHPKISAVFRENVLKSLILLDHENRGKSRNIVPLASGNIRIFRKHPKIVT